MTSRSVTLDTSKDCSISDDELDFGNFMQDLKDERGCSKSKTSNDSDDVSLDLDGFLGQIPEKTPTKAEDNGCDSSKLELGDLPSSSHWGSGFFNSFRASFRRRMSSTRMSFRRSSIEKMPKDPNKPRKKRVRFLKFEKVFNY